MISKLKAIIVVLIIVVLVLILLTPVIFKALFEPVLSDGDALKILNKSLKLDIQLNKAKVISKEYSTNIREEGYLIVCDVNDINIEETVRLLQLSEIELPITVEKDYYSEEINGVLNDYYTNNEKLFCRYGCDQLLDGTPHTASVYLMALSQKGRLLLFVEE